MIMKFKTKDEYLEKRTKILELEVEAETISLNTQIIYTMSHLQELEDSEEDLIKVH